MNNHDRLTRAYMDHVGDLLERQYELRDEAFTESMFGDPICYCEMVAEIDRLDVLTRQAMAIDSVLYRQSGLL